MLGKTVMEGVNNVLKGVRSELGRYLGEDSSRHREVSTNILRGLCASWRNNKETNDAELL